MKFGLSDEVLEKIIKVFDAHATTGQLVLFGSRVKGNFKEGSDIDIVLKNINLKHSEYLDLLKKMDELNLPYRIDLLLYSSINEPKLKEHIDWVGVVLNKSI